MVRRFCRNPMPVLGLASVRQRRRTIGTARSAVNGRCWWRKVWQIECYRSECRQNNTGPAKPAQSAVLPTRAVHARRLAVFLAALVAAELLLDADRRLIGARVGVGRHRFSLEGDTGIEMQRTLGPEAESVLLDRHVAGISAVEGFLERLDEPGIHPLAQGRADVEVLARDAKRHGDRPHFSFLLNMIFPKTGTHFSGSCSCVTPSRRAPPACRGAAAPRKVCAWPRGILRRFAAQCRCRPRAACRQWYRPRARLAGFPPRSYGGCGDAPLRPNGLRRRRRPRSPR